MRFRVTFWKRATAIALFGLLGSSCGILGNKSNIDTLLNYNPQAMGCLNQVGANIQAYYKGTIDAATWQGTWNCATQNLALFKQFVQPSDPNGFTQSDIYDFISKVLLTNVPITPDLVNAVFELKASLFGGTKDILALSEIDQVTNFLNVMSQQTTNLIPYLTLRVTDPTPTNLLALTDALVSAGNNIAASFNTQGNPTFSFSSAQVLANEIGKVINVNVPSDLVAWMSSVEVLVTAGATNGIAASDWPRLIRAAVAYGGPAIAAFSINYKYLVGPNPIGQFGMQLAWKIYASLMQTLELYGGAIPLTAIDSVLNSLPNQSLPIDTTVVEAAMRPAVNKILGSQVPNAIDANVINLIFNQLAAWNSAQTYLETIFQIIAPDSTGVTAQMFTEAATLFEGQQPASAKPEIDRLIALANHYLPLFIGNDNEITYTPNVNHSLHNLSTFNWIQIASEQIITAYSSVPGKQQWVQQDLANLLADFKDLIIAVKAFDPTAYDPTGKTVDQVAAHRFLEASILTPVSNGTQYLNLDETTYFLAMLLSAGNLSTRITNGTDQVCPSLGKDIIGYNWKDPVCFRRELFSNYMTYWDHMPLLTQFYSQLSSGDKFKLQKAMEAAARVYGYSDQPLGSVDEQGFAGVAQYVESLFARFDTNNNQILDLRPEAMNAFPIFKGKLAQFGHINPNETFILKAIFTYTLKHGEPPKTDFLGIMSLVAWIAQEPIWSLEFKPTRLELYQVLAAISAPLPPPTSTPSPKPAEERSIVDLAKELGISLGPPEL